MSKEEIALQLTLKAIERMSTPRINETSGKSSTFNENFSKDIVDFYNNIYKNLDLNQTIDV